MFRKQNISLMFLNNTEAKLYTLYHNSKIFGCSAIYIQFGISGSIILLCWGFFISLLSFIFSFCFWGSESTWVEVADTDKVRRQGTDYSGNVQAEYDFLFSGGSDESNSVVAGGDCVRFVEEPEIACIPSSEESNWNDN